MNVATDHMQITGGREALVSEVAFADEVAGRRALWWAGVPGLDPLHTVSDSMIMAQAAAMACGARVLGPDLLSDTKFRRGASRVTKEFFEWLTENIRDDLDSHRRRLALRLACDIPGLPAHKVLDGAMALHAAVSGR